ncbi:MAG TPA: hypothetical protein VMF67_07680 [Rhizomicrobium sp.]|nr:hypothetical protein [Rhizomicrobium sp.]
MRSLLFPEFFGIVVSLLRPVEAVGLDVEGFVLRIGGEYRDILFLLPPHGFGCFTHGAHEIAHGSPPSVVLFVPEFLNGLRGLFVLLAFRPAVSFCFEMPRRKKLWGDTLVTAREAATYSITSVHESTIRRWMKNGVTSFGMPLDVSVKDGHLAISLLQVHRVREELQRRDHEKFVHEALAFEGELELGIPLPSRRLQLTSPKL